MPMYVVVEPDDAGCGGDGKTTTGNCTLQYAIELAYCARNWLM